MLVQFAILHVESPEEQQGYSTINDFSVLAFPTPTSLVFATRQVNQSKPFADRDFCGDISLVSGTKCKKVSVVVIVKHFLPILRIFLSTGFGAARH